MMAKYFTILSLLGCTVLASPIHSEERGNLTEEIASGCKEFGKPGIFLTLAKGATAQAEDKSWGEQSFFSFFGNDSKEQEVFKLYKSQNPDRDGKTKIDGDAIATVSSLALQARWEADG
jgi:hypothetical protein